MPKRTDLKSILIIGSGPIVIGQACEFDYSGVQACKALKEEGYKVILVNSNPATIMTDPGIADKIYIEPIIPEIIEKIIQKDLPDAILPTMGGQTALNIAIELEKKGILAYYNVELIGAKASNIQMAEDRFKFRKAMRDIGLDLPRSFNVSSLEESWECLQELTFPVVVRSSFTLGGGGSNIIYQRNEFEQSILHALKTSPIKQAQLEEYLFGWKEFELEMMRDKSGNCIVVCAIENVNPMGVHTGDSITVAPILTLSDKEFQQMRDMAIAIMRKIGIDTGGANVQFAVNPKNGRIVVIEMNPRVSRSSALASKATGFPIAKISAKLAVGLTLDEIPNEITKTTYAAFEPTIDYIVTKIPRFSFEKFPEVSTQLTTSMKSVGEVMAIGRNFIESFQKAIVSLEVGLNGLDEIVQLPVDLRKKIKVIRDHLSRAEPNQFLYIAEAFRSGFSTEGIHKLCQYDPWFLNQIKKIVDVENILKKEGLPKTSQQLNYLKSLGFSNKRLSYLTNQSESKIYKQLANHKITPSYKCVDTCAAEFTSSTPYLYSTYEINFSSVNNCEASVSDNEKVIIVGSGPNRISQGIEFDYCCVQAALCLKELGYETIMINCNPETVSTDYSVSDRLYFEPLTEEHVLSVIYKEKTKGKLKGVILQLGGQTPLNLIHALSKSDIPILGTSFNSIELAENRKKFSKLLVKLNLRQPRNATATSKEEILGLSNKVGYPLILRPSYVIGGHKMVVIKSKDKMQAVLSRSQDSLFELGPVLIEHYLENAKEIDVDAISDGSDVYIAGIMEHFERAGIHSGDSTCSLPSFSLTSNILNIIKEYTIILCTALRVQGFINIQFAIKDEELFVLEVNPRASRTIPYLSKATGITFVRLATQLIIGTQLRDLEFRKQHTLGHVCVKQPIFSFSQLPGSDSSLNHSMKSTGEVMGMGSNLLDATAKACLSILKEKPVATTVLIRVHHYEELEIIPIIKDLLRLKYKIKLSQKNNQLLMNIKKSRDSIKIVDFKKENFNTLFQDVFLFIDTLNFPHEEKELKKHSYTELNILRCTTLQHAKGFVRALQFYLFKDLSPVSLTLDISNNGKLSSNHEAHSFT